MLAFILSLVLHVHAGESINAALDSARTVYAARGEKTTILIEPGTYQEELTIDVPGLTLKNACRKPSIGLKNGGVDCDKNAEKAMDTIRTQLSKLGDTPYIARNIQIESKPYFLPISVLNQWRRETINDQMANDK